MAQTIIYYDSTGKIIMSEAGNYTKPAGSVSYIETEIPDGYIPVSVGEGGEIITEALPLPSSKKLSPAAKLAAAAAASICRRRGSR